MIQHELRIPLCLIPEVKGVPNRTDLGAELDIQFGQLPLLSRDCERSPAATRRHNWMAERMAESFEYRDLSGAEFWGVDLRGATFRDVDLTDAKLTRMFLVNVDIDALVDRVVINGVDITDYVNERDPWYPLRALIRAPEP